MLDSITRSWSTEGPPDRFPLWMPPPEMCLAHGNIRIGIADGTQMRVRCGCTCPEGLDAWDSAGPSARRNLDETQAHIICSASVAEFVPAERQRAFQSRSHLLCFSAARGPCAAGAARETCFCRLKCCSMQSLVSAIGRLARGDPCSAGDRPKCLCLCAIGGTHLSAPWFCDLAFVACASRGQRAACR